MKSKKPTLWNIAILAGVAVISIVVIAMTGGPRRAVAVNGVLIAFFVIALILLVRAFYGQLRYNIYSYNTIYYAGFSLLLVFVIITHIRLAVSMAADPGSYGLRAVVFSLQNSGRLFIILSFPFTFLFSAGLIISNIALIKHEGKSIRNLLGVILGILILGGQLLLFYAGQNISGSAAHVMKAVLALQILTAAYLYCECMMIGTIAANCIASRHRPACDKDFIVILGCVFFDDGTPTPLLKGRIDKALEFFFQQKDRTGKEAVFIASGGQGADEPMAESRCMKNYITAHGVPECLIIEEDKSTDTHENFSFSKQKIIDLGHDAGRTKIAFSTSNYHVFRSGLKAKRLKLDAEGVGAATKWYFWPNAFVREFVGLMTEHRGKQLLVLGGMTAVYTLLTLVAFS